MVGCGSPIPNFGLPVTYCAVVTGSLRDSLGKNSGTILFMCGKYPYQGMTVVIKDLDQPMFDYKLDEWIGKTICATGVVGTYKGKPYIEIRKAFKLHVN
ncbi:MAG: hypothetical protein LH473_10480 [Chitinophagales bacterium]|nr:hypothetical protein [Chitinophagales bacterium]